MLSQFIVLALPVDHITFEEDLKKGSFGKIFDLPAVDPSLRGIGNLKVEFSRCEKRACKSPEFFTLKTEISDIGTWNEEVRRIKETLRSSRVVKGKFANDDTPLENDEMLCPYLQLHPDLKGDLIRHTNTPTVPIPTAPALEDEGETD